MEGTSYICRSAGVLVAINRSGRELWRINLGAPLAAPVLCGWDGRLFAFTEKKISCYTASGYPLWHKILDQPPALYPCLDAEGGFVVVLKNGELLQSDPFGKIRTRKLESVPAAVLSLKKNAPEKENSLLVFYKNRRVEISGEKSNESPRSVFLPGEALTAAGREGKAALTLKDGRVTLLNLSDGKILWTGESHIDAGDFKTRTVENPGEEIGMIYDERGIYVLSKSGASGFTEDGRRLWIMRLRGAAAVPAFSGEGILYSGGSDWILYAYKLEDRVRAQKQSVYGPLPPGVYGTGNPPPSTRADYYFRFDEGDMKTRLSHIKKILEAGIPGEEEKNFTAYLMELAGSSRNLSGAENFHPPVHIPYRVEAVRLLAYMGSRETVPFLADLFTRDPDPLVKAAAAEAVGRVGVDPDGTALRAFAALIFPPNAVHDEQVLMAAASAVGALCRFSGPPLSDTGVKLLVALGGDDRPGPVRRRAQRELKTLKP
jgi:outer membrane protein assembly factor BamB